MNLADRLTKEEREEIKTIYNQLVKEWRTYPEEYDSVFIRFLEIFKKIFGENLYDSFDY